MMLKNPLKVFELERKIKLGVIDNNAEKCK